MALLRNLPTVLSNSRHIVRFASFEYKKASKDSNFVVRHATSAHDLQFLPKIFSFVEPYDTEAYFSADPTGYFIGELRGKKISHISTAKYPHMIFFGLYVVDEHYQQRGFGMQTCKYAIEALGSKFQTESIVMVSVPEMKKLYEEEFGFRQEWINKEYNFKMSGLLSTLSQCDLLSVVVKPASTVDFEKLMILLALVDRDAPSCRNGLLCQVESV